MTFNRAFCPKRGGTLTIANAVAASAPVALGERDSEVMLYNSSATAIAFVRIDVLLANTDAGSNATLADLPVAPNTTLVVSPGVGFKTISVIASAANGNLYATPGHGGI